MKKFAVVYFEKDQRFAVIPSTWFTEDNTQCYWLGKKTKNKSTLQQDLNLIPDDTFAIVACKLIKSYGELEFHFIFNIDRKI